MSEMTVAAIAAEYNPFHNGHAYHIGETRAAGATHIVAIMSGNFAQRGTPAIAEKHARAHAALEGGADLVLELPLPYAMATAQRFAYGMVGVAEGMGCVSLLSFGSESGKLHLIEAAAEAIDSAPVCERMATYLETGMTFAKARHTAVAELCGSEVADRLGTPNDLLAVEYVRNLKLRQSKIQPLAVCRRGVSHDAAEPAGATASASYLRKAMHVGSLPTVAGLMPPQCLEVLRAAQEEGHTPFDERRLELMMMGVLRRLTPQELARLPDLSEGLENRLYSAIRQASSLKEVHELMKSKRYPAARIRRVVMSAFLGLDGALCMKPVPYVRVLGFNIRGRQVLSAMRKTATLPVSDSLSYLQKLGGDAAQFAEAEARATDLYRLALPSVLPCGYDYTANSIRILEEEPAPVPEIQLP